MYAHRVSGGLVLWIIVGVIVAASHHFFDALGTVNGFLSALVAVVLWPLVLFGVHLVIAI
ncbi:MAG: hypothetical protein ABR564_07280 [Candidatus Dormibacteria bacterium]